MRHRQIVYLCVAMAVLAIGILSVEPNALHGMTKPSRSLYSTTTSVIVKCHWPFIAMPMGAISLDELIENTDTSYVSCLLSVDSVSYRRLRDQLQLIDELDQRQGFDFRIVLIGPNERNGLDTIAFNQTGGVYVNGKMYDCDNQLFFAMARMLPYEYQKSMLMVGQE